jgi:hypothetical protein
MRDLEVRAIESKIVSPQQFALANQIAKKTGKSVWSTLINLGLLKEEDVIVFFSQETGIPYIKISDYKISSDVLQLLDEDFCRENLVIPLFLIKDTLYVATYKPLDISLQDTLNSRTAHHCELLFSSPSSIEEAINLYYGFKDRFSEVSEMLMSQRPLHSIPHYRSSERIPLNIPLLLKVEDKDFILNNPAPILGKIIDVSLSGTGLGAEIPIFIPKGLIVTLEITLPNREDSLVSDIVAKAEVIYSRFMKRDSYHLGLRFTEFKKPDRERLLRFATCGET